MTAPTAEPAPEPAAGWVDTDQPTENVPGGQLRPGDHLVLTMTPTIIETIGDPDDLGNRRAVFTDGRELNIAVDMPYPVGQRGPQ